MNFFKTFSIVALVALTYTSCKKEEEKKDDNTSGGKTNLELLTQKDWKVSGITASGNDVWGLVSDCDKDNQYNFRTDDSLVLYDNILKCQSTDPDSTVSAYKLYNQTKIILDLKISTIQLQDTTNIIEITESTMKLDANYSGIPATITFIHP
ncbi:MAG: hypothetical protein R2852_03620 [Bacteroidia bacterium]